MSYAFRTYYRSSSGNIYEYYNSNGQEGYFVNNKPVDSFDFDSTPTSEKNPTHKVYEVASSSDNDKTYLVRLDFRDKQFDTCSCPAFAYRKANEPCKHIKHQRAMLKTTA